MTREHDLEILELASRANRLCAIDSKSDINDQILEDARILVARFDPRLNFSSFAVEATYHTPGNPFNGLMQTDTGHAMGGSDQSETHHFEKGLENRDRIGLYTVLKVNQTHEYALYFEAFTDMVDVEHQVITRGDMTHILYEKKDKSLKGIVKSRPRLSRVGKFKVITYKQDLLWGKGKAELLAIRIQS